MPSKPLHSKKKGVITEKSTEVTSFEGLTPDPETLSKLEEICPGITERWMTLAEKEITERHDNERRLVKSFTFSSIFGSISAFASTLVIAGIGLYTVVIGAPQYGATIICGGIAQVIAAFHYRSKNKKN